MADLIQYYGTGRRKSSIARVFLRPGSGKFTVNGKEFEQYFVTPAQRSAAKQPLGIADIKMGKGGGARVARGNPRLFAEALAVQLDLTGVSTLEIMDAQRAIETLAAELAAENATAADHAKLKDLLAEAEALINDREAYTRSCRDFHLAVAEASHNRVLVTQLVSLQHVSWPSENRTLTPDVARRVLTVHRELATLIEMRDAAGARRLMDDHVKMIRARRVAEHGDHTDHCC